MPWLCCGRPRAFCDCPPPQRRHSQQHAVSSGQVHQGTEDAPTQAPQEVRGRSNGGRASGLADLQTTGLVHNPRSQALLDGSARYNTATPATTHEAAPPRISPTRALPVSSAAQQMSRPHVTTRTSALSQAPMTNSPLAPPHAERGSQTPQGASAGLQAVHSAKVPGMEMLKVSLKQELDIRIRRVEQSADTIGGFLDKIIAHHNDRVGNTHPRMGPTGSKWWVTSRWQMRSLDFGNEGTNVPTTSVSRE